MKKLLISGISTLVIVGGGAFALLRPDTPVSTPVEQDKVVAVTTNETTNDTQSLPKASPKQPEAEPVVEQENLEQEEQQQTPTTPIPTYSFSGVVNGGSSISDYFTPINEWYWTIDYQGCKDGAFVAVLQSKMSGVGLPSAKVTGDSGTYKYPQTIATETKDVNFRVASSNGCSWTIKVFNAE